MSVDERPLSGGDTDSPEDTGGSGQVPQDAGIYAASQIDEDTVVPALSVESFLSSAKAVTRSAYICMDGTLEEELDRLTVEYEAKTDMEGQPLKAEGDEPSLADKNEISQLVAAINATHAAMRAATRRVRFQRMPSDEYEVLEQRYRMSNGRIPPDKLPRFASELIVACAIDPVLTKEQVAALRHAMSKAQVRALDDAAFQVNNEGGTSAPKLPDYLSFLSPQES